MRIKTKIDFKRYFILTGLSTALTCTFVRSLNDFYGILIVYIGTILNHIMIMRGIKLMLTPYQPENEGSSPDRGMMAIYFIGKLVVLFGAIALGVHFMGNRVIIPVLNYVIQIFLLIYSLNDRADI